MSVVSCWDTSVARPAPRARLLHSSTPATHSFTRDGLNLNQAQLSVFRCWDTARGR